MGASDIGHEYAYMCKLPKLPPGTSKSLVHFVQCKRSKPVMRYNLSDNYIQDMIRNPLIPQKEIFRISLLPRKLLNGQFLQVGLRRNSLTTVPKISPKIPSSTSVFLYMIYHVYHVLFFVSR